MIDTAIILAAGEGTRLRDTTPFKPLCVVGERTLLDHALTGLAEAGITRAVLVLGYGGDAIEAHLATSSLPIAVETVRSDPRRPNGVSALAAAPLLVGAPALLLMCDHLVEPALYARLARVGAGDGLRLGIDRRLGHPWVDPLDVTCVATRGERITAIGKEMVPHDCYDTGVFAIGTPLFEALAKLADPSLTEGVRMLAVQGRARVVDCSDLDWIDVDDAAALRHAEAWLAQTALPRRAVAAG
ncbi:NTP transferase domain-containing protein [Sphingomonas bacterium]|uniref:phosphocholine cytidylyltransferase family protein n=1 Tax=Sphingomonas bacterium TaxID=1895847 RepID=UPI0015768E63|nr:NTP transferase domain-containing protein [Sphingomonas bacterium]